MTYYGTNMVFRLNTAQAEYGYYIKSIRFYTKANKAYVEAYAKNLAATNENIKLEDYNWENSTDLYNVATWYAAPGQHDTEVTLVCPESFYAGALAGGQYSATDVTKNTNSCNTLPILKFEKFELEYEVYKYEPTAPSIPSLYNNSKLLGLGETFFFASGEKPSLSFSKGSDSDQDNIVVFYKYVPEGTPAENVQYIKGDLSATPQIDTTSGALYWYAADAVDESFKSDVAIQAFKTYPQLKVFDVKYGNGSNDTPNPDGILWVYTQDNPTGEKYVAGKTYNDILRMVFVPSDPELAKDAIIIESDFSAGGSMKANSTWMFISNPAKMKIRTQNGGNLYSVTFHQATSNASPKDLQFDDQYHSGKWTQVNNVSRTFTYNYKEYVFNVFKDAYNTGNSGADILSVTYIPAEPKIPETPYATLAPNGRGSDNGGIFKMIDGLDLQINSKTPVYYYPTTDNTVTSVPLKDDYHTLQPGQVLKVENSWFNGKSTGKILLQSTLWTPKGMDGGVAPVFIEVINTTKYAKLSEIIKPDNTGRDLVVTPSAPMTITGVYATRKDGGAQLSSYYAYVVDSDGTAIKLVSTSPFPASYTAGAVIPAGGLVGEFRYSYGAPEIVVSNYTGFLKETTPGTAPEPAEVTTISTSNDDGAIPDFNRKVVLRHAKWLRNTKSSQVEDTEGNRYLIYSRLITPGVEASEFTEDMFKSEAGTLWAIEGYVGQVEGATAIFPTAKVLPCPATPTLLAPNPISDDVNAISPEVNVKVNRTEGYTYHYKTAEDGELKVLPEVGLTLKAGDYTTTPCDLWVYASANGLYSWEPAHVTITWHPVIKTYTSIADFKAYYLNDELTLPGSLTEDKPEFGSDETVFYTQFSPEASAVVVETTPEWLYIRDNFGDEFDYTSNNYLMIHNRKKWHNPQVGEGENARDLAPGDIITNFALIPAHTSRGNLVSESTGFARTVQFVKTIPGFEPAFKPINVGYVEESNPGFHKNITLGEAERMRLVQLKNVKIKNPEEDVYTLVIGPDDAEPITLAFDIFTQSVNGFRTAYNPDNADELYDIKGVLIRDNRIKDSETYAIALISFDTQHGAVAAPEVFVQGTTDAEAKAAEVQEFEHGLVVEIAPEEGSFVYYSLNGKDPLNNTDAESRISYSDPIPVTLPEGQDRVVVKAFAYRPGYKPSATVTRTFVKTSRELSYLLNFINQGEQGRAYHFNGNVRIAAVAGNWMMVRGSVGHYLPIYNADGWNTTDYAAEKYLTDFLMTFDNTEGNIRGMAKDFKPSTDKPADIKEIELTPDSVTFISEANARRYVKLYSARVAADATTAAEGDAAASWTVTGSNHQGAPHRLDISSLGTATGAETLEDGALYDITGFVMLDTEGNAELWATGIQKIAQTPRVSVSVNGQTLSYTADGDFREYEVELEDGDLVALECPHRAAVIKYSYDDKNWYTYGEAFMPTNSMIHAYAQAPGERASAHTHITITRKDVAGNVAISVDNSTPGKAVVELTASENGDIIWWTSKDNKEKRYTGAITLTETAIIYAQLRVDGKKNGAESYALVEIIAPSTGTPGNPGTPDIPADKISGKVVFSIDDTSDPTKVTVYLAPEEGLTGTIYYLINPTGQVTPENGTRYENPIEMKEGGRIVAILVESGKYAGEPTDIAVWLIPTDIDGIGSERREDEIRAEGGSIIAPEGSEVFDITGRRVNATGLRAGIYIVRTPGGKAVKVKVD